MISAIVLSLIGILFIFSAGTYWGNVHYDGQTPFYLKQAIYFIIALIICAAIMNWEFLQQPKVWKIFYIISLGLLVAVLIPGIGIVRNGSQSDRNRSFNDTTG